MNKPLRPLFLLASAYLAMVGLGLTLVPTLFGFGAVPAEPPASLIAFLRILGGPCLGIAVLNWFARDVEASPARQAILLGNAVGFSVVATADVWGLFHHARELAKLFLVVHTTFAVAFIFAVLRDRRPGRPQ